MKGLETTLFALTLFFVPAFAWALGRFLGRRDVSIVPVLVAGGFAALLPHLGRFAVLASLDPRPFADALLAQVNRSFDSPEIGLFFVTFGVFMTMLGWTATPVLVSKT